MTPGKALRQTDVEIPVVVQKGSLVTVVYRSNNMTLTAEARALQNGGQDEPIRVINTQSNRTLQGRVVGPNAVEVGPNQIRLSAF